LKTRAKIAPLGQKSPPPTDASAYPRLSGNSADPSLFVKFHFYFYRYIIQQLMTELEHTFSKKNIYFGATNKKRKPKIEIDLQQLL